MIAHNLFLLSITFIAERSLKVYSQNAVISAVNYNQLPYFMVSNLLTGVVNLSISTIFTADLVAVSILIIYQLVAISLFYSLFAYRMKFKFW